MEDGPAILDVLVSQGRIAAVEAPGVLNARETVDATGLAMLPGMIDMHVHIDDFIGGIGLADDFPSASELAARNGITSLVGFATQGPGESLSQTLGACVRRGTGRSHCDFSFHMTPLVFSDEAWADIESLRNKGWSTLKLYTTYKEAGLYTGWDQLETIMTRCVDLDLCLLIHCEAEEILSRIEWSEVDLGSAKSHSMARPVEAEVAAIQRVVELAERHGTRTHVVHVSSVQGANVVNAGRRSAPLTMETAPHYLFFCDRDLEGLDGHFYLCSPPLRDVSCRDSLAGEAEQGNIQVMATDHCAFRTKDKDCFDGDYRKVPCGVPGLGALVPMSHRVFSREAGDPLTKMARHLAAEPAKVCGLYPRKGVLRVGSDADIVLINTDGPSRPVRSTLADVYDIYRGETTTLEITAVYLRGHKIVEKGELAGSGDFKGECVWPL